MDLPLYLLIWTPTAYSHGDVLGKIQLLRRHPSQIGIPRCAKRLLSHLLFPGGYTGFSFICGVSRKKLLFTFAKVSHRPPYAALMLVPKAN